MRSGDKFGVSIAIYREMAYMSRISYGSKSVILYANVNMSMYMRFHALYIHETLIFPKQRYV